MIFGAHGLCAESTEKEEKTMKMKRMAIACAVALGSGGMAFTHNALAQSTNDLKQQVESMQKQIDSLKTQVDQQQTKSAAAAPASPASTGGHEFLERKPGEGFSFYTRGGETTIYGNIDLSIDDTTKGISGMVAPDGSTPVGNGGWMAAISSNLSYVGIRGFQDVGSKSFHFVYQLETEIIVSASSGTTDTNSNQSNVVKGGLTSRNSFIGLADSSWGAVKIGKTDAPYKNSTARMNPFSGMIGDYAVIMGNTGGDNRVEFGTRVDHSLWYESPTWAGLNFNALFSPGQNRSLDSSNIAAGESDCAGGNIPGSGGTPQACNDGSFSNLYSVSVQSQLGGLYVTGAYEMHKKVNRTSDLFGNPNDPNSNALGFDPNDVGDEEAGKVGIQYIFSSTGTTISGIYERMKRHVPDYLEQQNERSRNGTWLALSQSLGAKDSIHFGWAHAYKTPGDPGQHNTGQLIPAGAIGFADADNSANMYTALWRHQVDRNLSYYATIAETVNHQFAHYDLGAGGRSVTTDCHDASNPDTSGFDPNGGAPKCWAGATLKGVSVGMKYTF
jgi:predicted porin